MIDVGILGTILTLALGAAGSAVGCGLAGMTSHGVMARTDEGHGSFILLSAMPSSQTIYGFVLMFPWRYFNKKNQKNRFQAIQPGRESGA
jgi:V/A-type H+-transporting ATPase subunit K